MEADPSDQHVEMNSFDYWRLCDELSIFECASLLVGKDPSEQPGDLTGDQDHQASFEAAKNAISRALLAGTIKGKIVPIMTQYFMEEFYEQAIEGSVNERESRVEVESLRAWLCERGYRTGFFFPAASSTPDYLDPSNPRYAPRLAAAVRAWEAVTDSKGKTPKQALIKWLREHAAEFSLNTGEGKPNETGIEEVAKVANWNSSGGAPKTPTVSGG